MCFSHIYNILVANRKLNSLKMHFKNLKKKLLCHPKAGGVKAVLIRILNSAWKNTQETQIIFIVTKICFISVIGRIEGVIE